MASPTTTSWLGRSHLLIASQRLSLGFVPDLSASARAHPLLLNVLALLDPLLHGNLPVLSSHVLIKVVSPAHRHLRVNLATSCHSTFPLAATKLIVYLIVVIKVVVGHLVSLVLLVV